MQISKPDRFSRDAKAVRLAIVDALFSAGGGHYGGALSVADVLMVLYKTIVLPKKSSSDEGSRDRVILSKGHAAIALYAVLKNFGILDLDLHRYGAYGARLEGHPDMTQTPGIDFSTGSLGQGLSAGLGMAFALRGRSHVWVIVGDGECQEGQVWEAAMIAARYSICNIHVVVDANGAQECGWTYDLTLNQSPVTEMKKKWKSFEWLVRTVDGHDCTALRNAYTWARSANRPNIIIANTIKGKGIRSIESNPSKFHCATLTLTEHERLMGELDES